VTIDDKLWIRRYHPAPGDRTRLVCLPHAGGSASFFFPLSAALAPAVEVLAVQYPGRQDRRAEPCVRTVDEMADRVVGVLRASEGDRPVALFGHSMGALVAFEVALRMEQDGGVPPVGLVASGRPAPSVHREERAHLLDDAGLIAEIRSLSGTDATLLGDEELLRTILPPLRSDYRAVGSYRYRPGSRLRCPVSAFVGDRDPRASREDADAWREMTSASFRARVFPGGHFYLDVRRDEVAEALSGELAAFRAERARPPAAAWESQ
jgi:pyochelin biosynthesis protein PchC